eukprot:15436251-Alexandrium_andersonii.AAC.1
MQQAMQTAAATCNGLQRLAAKPLRGLPPPGPPQANQERLQRMCRRRLWGGSAGAVAPLER